MRGGTLAMLLTKSLPPHLFRNANTDLVIGNITNLTFKKGDTLIKTW